MKEKEYIPSIAMSIQAHPDDQEFTIAGTLARWVQHGCQVISVIVTSGEAGSNDPAHAPTTSQSWRIYGKTNRLPPISFWASMKRLSCIIRMASLQATLGLRKDLTRLIRQYKPDVVITGDPTRVFNGRTMSTIPITALRLKQPFMPPSPPPARVRSLPTCWMKAMNPTTSRNSICTAAKKPDVWVDTSETLDLKIAALKKHAKPAG